MSLILKGKMSEENQRPPQTEEEIIEAVAALFEEMVRDGNFVWVTDEQGNQVFRDGQPAYALSPLQLNKQSGIKGLN